MAKNQPDQDNTPVLREPTTDLEKDILASGGLVVTDPAEVSAAIASRIMGSNSIADILSPQTTEGADDVVGIPLNLRGVRWLHSSFKDGPVVYALIDAVDRQGKARTITSGSETVLAQLFRISQLDGFPVSAAFVRASKATAQGYYPLWLEAVDPNADF